MEEPYFHCNGMTVFGLQEMKSKTDVNLYSLITIHFPACIRYCKISFSVILGHNGDHQPSAFSKSCKRGRIRWELVEIRSQNMYA